MKLQLSPEVSSTLDMLFGENLIPIKTVALIERYNAALKRLGITETSLQFFRIDQMGWSPEIALERNDPYYLSAGLANPMAIIVTPDQRNAPLVFPFHSYDKNLFQQYFQEHSAAIADVTTVDSLGVYLDKEVSTFFCPEDLFLVRYVIVRTTTGELPNHAAEQRNLTDRFIESPLGWFDRTLRSDIIDSARLHGDLRSRKLEIPDMQFAELQNFHTRAFGGVFIFRGLAQHPHLMILEDKEHFQGISGDTSQIFHINDARLIDVLIEEELLELNLDWYCVYPEKLQELLSHLEAEILCQSDPDQNPNSMTAPQKARKLQSIKGNEIDLYHELERLIRKLEDGKVPTPGDNSMRLNRLLLRPGLGISESNQLVIEQLICRLGMRSPQHIFNADPGYFVEKYSHWPQSMKSYALEQLDIQLRTTQRSDR